jgi:hypothetical protein
LAARNECRGYAFTQKPGGLSTFSGKFHFETTDLKLAPFPNSLAAILRGFTFYLAVPISSIRG